MLSTLLQHKSFLISLVINVVVGLVLSWVSAAVIARLYPLLKKSKRLWDDTLLDALSAPLHWCIWLFVLLSIASSAYSLTQLKIAANFVLLRKLLIFVFLLWFLLRYINRLQQSACERIQAGNRQGDLTSVSAFALLGRLVVVVVVLLLGMQTAGLSISALLTFGGVGGIAIGFAAKDSLANFIGGLMIYMDRPFKVGDWVQSPDRKIEGTVKHIGWRLTEIMTFDHRPLYVPNSLFSTIVVVNPSRMTNRRIYTHIGLRYQDGPQLRNITKAVDEMLHSHPDISQTDLIMVKLDALASSSINFFIYCFTKTKDWVEFQSVQQDVLLKIMDIVYQHNADFAYPTQTLLIDNANSPQPQGTPNER